MDSPVTTPPVLEVRDLSVNFTTEAGEFSAIRNVSFSVYPGQLLAIVGESGSGKSTTAACLNRLLAPNGRIVGGQILFGGQDLAGLSEKQMTSIRGAGIGFVPQDPMSNLNPIQKVGTQIVEALEVHGRAKGAAAKAEAIRLLEAAGIQDAPRRFNQYPHEFSGGMRQRVLIAMGLACEPTVLIADEPTSALDVTVQRTILDQLTGLAARMGTAVILITHDLALAAERADQVLVMWKGEVVEHGQAREILENPTHEYTRRLLDAAPNLNSRRIVSDSADRVEARERDGLASAVIGTGNVVELHNVTKQFPGRSSLFAKTAPFTAVSDVSFTLPRGRTVAIVGESGSGKSTTARMVLGLEEPTSGSIDFDGVDLASLGRRELFEFRRKVQPVFQNPYGSLDSRYTVGRSIAEPLELHRIGTRLTQKARVAELLDQVSLPTALASRLPHELSGGQRQRVAIARALALSPELVVLDEAVSALDVIVQAAILELLAALQAELGLSYLFISHDLAVVRMISHEVHVMQHGRVVESGTPDEIFDAPREDYTRQLLAAIPGSALRA
ncbi:MAG: peptide/nickel transport system ATP-binding protein ddpF [Subtercola sp.]|nr:peptide/nickel transport system ATP-binding protein ddpF [Subtercola sp.]